MKAFMTTSDTKHGIERESVLIKKLLHGIGHLSTGQVGWCVLNAQRCRACQVPNIWLYPNFTSTRTCLKHFIALHISVTSTSKASQPCRMSAPRCNLPPVLSAVLQGVVRQLELCSLAQYVMASYAMLISTFLCSKRGFRVFLNRLTCRRSRLCSFSAQLQQPKLGQVSFQGLASACRRSPWNPWLPSVWPHLSRVAQNHCSTAHASEEQGDQILGRLLPNVAVVLIFIVSRNSRGTHRFTHDSHTHLICFLCFLSMAFEHSNHGSSSTPASNGVILPRVVCKLLSSEGVVGQALFGPEFFEFPCGWLPLEKRTATALHLK